MWQVDAFESQGQSVIEALRTIGEKLFTRYPWRKELGDLITNQVNRLKELEKQNEWHRKVISNFTIVKPILREAGSRNF